MRAMLTFALAMLDAGASAQVGPRAPESVERAVERARATAMRETPRSSFTRELDLLARSAERVYLQPGRRGIDEFDRQYRRTRRALFEPDVRASEELLDQWDRVAVAWHRVQSGAPLARRRPLPARGYLEFRGQFESLPVRVAGRSADELYGQCLELVRGSGLESAREVWIDGQRVVRRRGAFSPEAACAIGVLNAVPESGGSVPIVLNGSIDAIPFALGGPIEQARDVVRRYVPIVTRNMRISRLTIGGQVYLQPQGWSSDDVVVWMDQALTGEPRQRYTVR